MKVKDLFLQFSRYLTFCIIPSSIFLMAVNAAGSEETDQLIAGAKKEGKVAYYVSMNQENATQMVGAFEQKYPFIKVEMFRLPAGNLLVKALAEEQAGKFRADIYDSSLEQISIMKQKGLLMKYSGPESKDIPAQFKDPDGFWTATYIMPTGIVYNTKLISPQEAPKTYEDLLNPKYKGKMGIDDSAEWYFLMLKIMGREKGLNFMKGLARQDLMMRKGNTLLLQLSAAGEVPIVVWAYLENVGRLQSRGAPIDWVRMKSFPSITLVHGVSIVSTAPHPNAAKLLYNFSTSIEGARVFREMRRNPIRSEEQNPEIRNLKLYMPHSDELLANYSQVVREFKEIFKK